MNLDFELGFDATITGFDIPEIDLIIQPEAIEEAKFHSEVEEDFLGATIEIPQRVKKGDKWKLGESFALCSDSLNEKSYAYLMGEDRAEIAFVDYPYNVCIQGHVCGKGKTKHPEFEMASGEMKQTEFTGFLATSMTLQMQFSIDGSIHFCCMDWRHIPEMMDAANTAGFEFKNLCVWDKSTAGMGSLYRS